MRTWLHHARPAHDQRYMVATLVERALAAIHCLTIVAHEHDYGVFRKSPAFEHRHQRTELAIQFPKVRQVVGIILAHRRQIGPIRRERELTAVDILVVGDEGAMWLIKA